MARIGKRIKAEKSIVNAAIRYYDAQRLVLGDKPGKMPASPYRHLDDAAFSVIQAVIALRRLLKD